MSADVRKAPMASAFTVVFARGVVLVAGLATGVLTARALGPEGRGQYFAITTTAAIVAQFGNLGLSSSNVFLGAREPRLLWPLLINSAWVAVAICVLSALFVFLFSSTLSGRVQGSPRLWWAVAIIAPALLFFTLGSSLLTAEERFSALSGWQVANALITLALLGTAAAIDRSSAAFVCATSAAAFITAIALFVSVARGRRGNLRFDSAAFGSGWGFASKAYLALLLGYLMQRASVTLLIAYSSSAQIGLYSIASQIFDVLLIVPSSIAMVIFPRLVKESRGTWSSIREPLKQTLMLVLGICAVTILAAKPAIRLVFGAAFEASYDCTLWILPAAVFMSVVSVLSQFLVAKEFPFALIVVWAVGFAVMCAASIVLIRPFGAEGAAMAQSIGAGTVLLGVAQLVRNRVSLARASG